MEFTETSLPETADEIRTADIVTYIESLCERIERINPDVEALLPETDRRSRLMTAAGRLRNDSTYSTDTLPLCGVPVGIKDIFHVDGFATKAGGAVPPHLFGGSEAAVVRSFREHGAIIAGKTVSTEFVMSAPGPTRNPHDLEHTPGGSSSGSAAAVAAGLCPVAVGTQTNGSVIRPAAFCGIVGFKPTYDRIPTDGLVTLSPSADHVGLFTRTVKGMQRVASVVCSEWESTADLSKPTLGVVDGPYLEQASPEARHQFEATVRQLEAAGYDTVRATAFPDIEATNRHQENLTSAEIALSLGGWLEDATDAFRETTVQRIRNGFNVTAEELMRARRNQSQLRDTLTATAEDNDIDIWLSPAAVGPAPAGIDDTGSPIMNKPWTHAGVPAVTVPAGTVEGLPIGLQLTGRWMADESLLARAAAIAETVSS